ncbi:MarR family winged helix-turn-helix transcriptional regulator [Streptomyces sp. NPDC001544]|uniref:MarR family winged helix-turn-helix transcriptional regulator n=1 Tax=Streptomyces sp. NPDC001544 TaxID=3364584 RepID=UPI0036796354
MTTTTPLVDGRVIGLAHYASRAVLERVLAPHGVTFQQFVTLRLATVADGPMRTDDLVDGVVTTVKAGPADVRGTVEELVDAGLLAPEEPLRIRVTDAGRELYAKGSAETTAVATRLYAGIPEADRAAAGRVLSLVTERANAELAALDG